MISDWLGRIRWALLVAIVAGPGFAYFSYTQLQTIERIMAEGVEVEAVVDGGTSRKGRRSLTRSYKLHALWEDQTGSQRSSNLTISSEFASQVVEDDYLLIDVIQVKYLPGETTTDAVVVADAAQQIADQRLMIWLGAGAGVLGLFGSAAFFLFGRKKPAAQPEARAVAQDRYI